MFRKNFIIKAIFMGMMAVSLLVPGGLVPAVFAQSSGDNSEHHFWQKVGERAAFRAMAMLRVNGIDLKLKNSIALTNAGYAEINDRFTTGALDGLSRVLRVSRGCHSLIEIHSASNAALWFAIYDKKSGFCVYLQIDTDTINTMNDRGGLEKANIFSAQVIEQINAAHLFENAEAYAKKFDHGIFGGNEFRIVTIANAVAAQVPTYAVRSFEFHDHFCPGVTSGILMAQYIKTFMPLSPGGRYFVQTVVPWCKEDALLMMLNTTPGKKGYSVTYPTDEDIAARPDWAKEAATIVYRLDPGATQWDGVVLGRETAETGCPEYGHSVMDKLCADLWYLEQLEQPEKFIKVLYEFKLAEGVDPKTLARPGVDPILMLDQLKTDQSQ